MEILWISNKTPLRDSDTPDNSKPEMLIIAFIMTLQEIM